MGDEINRLTDLDMEEVSLVKRGANKKRFALAKGTNVTLSQVMKELLEKGEMPAGFEKDGEVDAMCKEAGLDAPATEAFKAIMKLAGTYKDSPAMKALVKAKLPAVFGGAEGGTEEHEQDMDASEKAQGADVGKPGAPVATDNKSQGITEHKEGEGMDGGEEDEAEKARKANPNLRRQQSDPKQLEKGMKELEKVQKALDDEKTAREKLQKQLDEQIAKAQKVESDAKKAQWVAKAERELAYVPGQSAQELGEMLHAMEPTMAEKQFAILKATSEALKKSEIFKQAGFQQIGDSSGAKKGAYAEAVQKSAERVQKVMADGGLTREEATRIAVTKYFKENPEEYARYLEENPQQTSAR